jgi:hypothetical protein
VLADQNRSKIQLSGATAAVDIGDQAFRDLGQKFRLVSLLNSPGRVNLSENTYHALKDELPTKKLLILVLMQLKKRLAESYQFAIC